MGYVPVGKIVGAHGTRGTCRVYSYLESPSVLRPGDLVLLGRHKDQKKNCEIIWVKAHKKTTFLLALKEITTRNQVEQLVGYELFLDRMDFPELEKGTYYWHDLIGLAVYAADEEYLGRVTSIIPTGGNDVYVVKNIDPDQEILIPAIESVILEIDLNEKIMRVQLPDGLR